MINPKLPAILYGGDYNPEQWCSEVWEEDMRLFRLAGINLVNLGVFSWAKLQPAEDQYDFGWLDRIMDMLAENGIFVNLATPTAAQPAWMSRKYPEILPVDAMGRKRTYGKRVNFCPNSRKYREFSVNITRRLAERYRNHPALLMWHVANEYGTYCYCDNCQIAFRKWLKRRYHTIEELNQRWNLSFWGHTAYDWEDIVVPSDLNDDNKYYQPAMLDYLRFMTDSNLECYLGEYQTIKEITPDLTVTTNISGHIKNLDQFRWAEHVDIAAWDNYPLPTDAASTVAFRHDLMRGLKRGQPYMLAEQTPSSQNWQPYNLLKRPGVMRLLSYQAIAHGADTVLFFQLRASAQGVEKLHGAVISHAGHEHTRVFRECAELGRELKQLGKGILDSRIHSKVAILFDWENWWAVELCSGPSRDLKYLDQVAQYYRPLYGQNISVDIVRPGEDLSSYQLVIAPLLYMVKPGVAGSIERFVGEGGTFLASFFSGMVDGNDRIFSGGAPGELRKVLGIWVEESDALFPSMRNSMVLKQPAGEEGREYECGLLCDIIHTETAKVLAVYGEDFYAGQPCFTVNQYGKGKAFYVGTEPEDSFLQNFMKALCQAKRIEAPILVPNGVEVTQRWKEGQSYTFILNHGNTSAVIDLGKGGYWDLITESEKSGNVELEPKGVWILERK